MAEMMNQNEMEMEEREHKEAVIEDAAPDSFIRGLIEGGDAQIYIFIHLLNARAESKRELSAKQKAIARMDNDPESETYKKTLEEIEKIKKRIEDCDRHVDYIGRQLEKFQ